MTTKYQQHVLNWRDCTLCTLCQNRKHVVLARGKLPCDILFIGEAPGNSEDVLGSPFVGPAGKLLDSMISKAIQQVALDYEPALRLRLAFTNLVACIPAKSEGVTEPTEEEILSCKPRLQELVSIAKPELLFCVGTLATNYAHVVLDTLDETIEFCSIIHPAAILRGHTFQKSIAINRCVETLTRTISNHFEVPF